MSGGGPTSPAAAAPATSGSGNSQQEFGTLWIQDQNGVSQMIRVLQATPANVAAAGTGGGQLATVPLAGQAAGAGAAAAAGAGPQGVVRAIIKTATPAGQPPQVIRRVQLQQGGQAMVARPTRAVLGSGTRVLTISPQRSGVNSPAVVGSPLVRRSVQLQARGIPKRRVLPTGPPAGDATRATLSLPRHPSIDLPPSKELDVLERDLRNQSSPEPQPVPIMVRASPGTPPRAAAAAAAPRGALITSILDHSGARKRQRAESGYWYDSKRRRTEKSSKGLRHFSMKVCEKVREKGTTTYNEVADELVTEYTETSAERCESPSEQHCDQKNIRRRVYDALNVLMAMNIIRKERKEIKWLGLPTNSLQECKNLEREKAQRMHRINVKTQQLKDLILQQIAFKNLVERNRQAEEMQGPPPVNSTVQLPFIIVNTSKKTVIDCSISNDKMEYLFNFDDTFEIHDDIEVLKRMGLALGLENGTCKEGDVEKAKSMVPPSLAPYIDQLARDGADSGPLTVDLETELSTAGLGSGPPSASERGESATPSIDFDSDEDDDENEEDDDVIFDE